MNDDKKIDENVPGMVTMRIEGKVVDLKYALVMPDFVAEYTSLGWKIVATVHAHQKIGAPVAPSMSTLTVFVLRWDGEGKPKHVAIKKPAQERR